MAADISFGSVTGLFGTNSSGKSSLLQFILLLKQTKDATDRGLTLELSGRFINLGSYHDFIHNHEENNKLSWSLDWNGPKSVTLVNPSLRRNDIFERGRNLQIKSIVDSNKGAARSTFLEYKIGKHRFRMQPKAHEPTSFDLKSSGDFVFKRAAGRVWQLPGPVKAYGFPDQAQTYFQNSGFLAQLVASFEEQMDRIFYLGPIRSRGKREYVWNRSRPSDVGIDGERTIEAILSATERREFRNLAPKTRRRPFQEMIAYWLQRMGLVHSFAVKEIAEGSGLYQAKVRITKDSPEVLLTEVGTGVAQVLPVLTLLYYVEENSTVILEQPEIHLHPLAQAALADVILSVAEHRNVQIIVESHSEHLLLRLQRRVAEGETSPDEVKLYFCDPGVGQSELIPLKLDLFGTIENWPKNFFGDAFGETAKAQLARLKRRKSH